MPRNKTGFPQPPMTRSRWCNLPSTRQRDPPRRTLSCRYTTPGSKTWVNRTNKVRNFHLILIIMNDGYVLRQFANTEHHLLNPKTTEYDSLLYLNHIQMLYSITGEERINKITLKWRHIDVSVLYKNRGLLTFFQYRLTSQINIIGLQINRPLLPPRSGISSHIWETIDPANTVANMAANTPWQHCQQQANTG